MGVKRINITLPEDVIQILAKETSERGKSSYIAEAIRSFSKKQSKEMLLRDMIKGYTATAKEDLEANNLWDNTLEDGADE